MNKQRQRKKTTTAVTVPFRATPTRETPAISQWAQPLVWTESMLTTLTENKVRGGKWQRSVGRMPISLR